VKLDILRQQLINGTIQVIAEEGLDKATTKQIGTKTGINEAYIYRCFKCKEDMFAKTFESLDLELIAALKQYSPILYKSDLPHEEKHKEYFTGIWNFLITNREKCITYIRYYYSPYFLKYSSEDHHARFAPVIANFAKLFKEEANVRLIMKHMLNVALDFAVKVFNNEMPDEDEFTEHVFLVIYRSIQPYFKEEDLI
jgi:AcrR family transcriptional regulator